MMCCTATRFHLQHAGGPSAGAGRALGTPPGNPANRHAPQQNLPPLTMQALAAATSFIEVAKESAEVIRMES